MFPLYGMHRVCLIKRFQWLAFYIGSFVCCWAEWYYLILIFLGTSRVVEKYQIKKNCLTLMNFNRGEIVVNYIELKFFLTCKLLGLIELND